MTRSFRFATVAVVLALTTAFAAGCGGSSSTDANDLLKETFAGGHTVKSGNLSVALGLKANGLKSIKGPVALKLTGPFQSLGKGQLPAFDLSVSLLSNGTSFSAGAVSTGDKGWLKLQGNAFAVGDKLFQQFKTGYEKASSKSKSGAPTFSSLGIDPLSWLKNPKTVGTETLGGAETYHITAGLNVAQFLDDVSTLLSKASALSNTTGTKVPNGLTTAQRAGIAASVKSATLDVWTGKDDKTLRRLGLKIAIDVPQAIRAAANGLSTGNLVFDLTIADLNKPQTITPPKNARPLSDLQTLLAGQAGGGSGATGGAGSGGSGATGGAGSGGGSSSGGGASSSPYLTCLQEAGNDVAKIQQCAALAGQ